MTDQVTGHVAELNLQSSPLFSLEVERLSWLGEGSNPSLLIMCHVFLE
jgi:hypothetical protein